MKIFFEVLIALLLCIVIFALIYTIKKMLLTPVHPGAGEKIFFIVAASGDAPDLQHTLSGLRLLADESGGGAQMVVADTGLTSDARRRAGLLCGYDGKIALMSADDLPAAVRQQ
ncbi:MAG: hypothetical protein AB7C97_07240 [Oscillospiraceae bacterium]